MSVNYHAYVFYGDVFSRDAIKSENKGRGCTHAETSAKFCGECGKPMWETRSSRILDHASSAGDMGFMECFYESHEVVIGVCLAVVSDFHDVQFADIPAADNKVKGRLGQLAKDLDLDMSKARLILVMNAG